MQVRRHGKSMLWRIRKGQLQLVPGREALVRLEERDQLAENLAHVAAIDLVDDEHVLLGEDGKTEGR